MTFKVPRCWFCKHLISTSREQWTCKAFPDGVPDDVLWNRHDHTKPYPGDHGIRFEAREPAQGLDRLSIDRIKQSGFTHYVQQDDGSVTLFVLGRCETCGELVREANTASGVAADAPKYKRLGLVEFETLPPEATYHEATGRKRCIRCWDAPEDDGRFIEDGLSMIRITDADGNVVSDFGETTIRRPEDEAADVDETPRAD